MYQNLNMFRRSSDLAIMAFILLERDENIILIKFDKRANELHRFGSLLEKRKTRRRILRRQPEEHKFFCILLDVPISV